MDILCILCKQVFLSQKNVDITFIIHFPKVFPKLKVVKTSIIIECSSHLFDMPLFLVLSDLILGKIPKWNGDMTMSNECKCRMLWENACLLDDAHSFSKVSKMFLHIYIINILHIYFNMYKSRGECVLQIKEMIHLVCLSTTDCSASQFGLHVMSLPCYQHACNFDKCFCHTYKFSFIIQSNI